MKSEITIKINTKLKDQYKMLEAELHDEILNYIETYIAQDSEDFEQQVLSDLADRDASDILEDSEGLHPAEFSLLGKVSIKIESIGVDE